MFPTNKGNLIEANYGGISHVHNRFMVKIKEIAVPATSHPRLEMEHFMNRTASKKVGSFRGQVKRKKCISAKRNDDADAFD